MTRIRILVSLALVAVGVSVASNHRDAYASTPVVSTCASSHLTVRVGTWQGTAGTIYYPIIFTNTGPACAIWGVPQLQPVVGGLSRSRVHVGPAARNVSMGQMPARHVVATGRSVSDAFGVAESSNYPVSGCRPRTAHGVVVSFARFVVPTYVALTISVCTLQSSTTTRLISPGTTGA